MSLDTLRNQVLSNADGEERVEVNQRHLIDKILARYSAEFVVFRELMQNADDAKSSKVEIIFETAAAGKAAGRLNAKDKCTRILFKNNGFVFRPEDWNRLKKIAEGNPDEQKIGAFGVGFYSLFSVCEEPFVSSGGHGMAFYWRGDQLFAKRGPTDSNDQWTTFLMDVREPMEIPNPEQFGRFLATSIGFTGNLCGITVYIDDTEILKLSKKMSDSRTMDIASGLSRYSPRKMFHLKSVDVRNVQIDVERLLVTSSTRTAATCPKENGTVFLRIAAGHLDVHVTKEFSAEMERSTKKKPPSKTMIQMLFSGFDEHNSSATDNSQKKASAGIFKDLLPYPEQGRIFIGFPTHQTTGCSSHLAARVIPTVERESIDLVDKTLAVYNEEMLSISGVLSRVLYEDEMNQISRLYKEIVGSNTDSNDEAIRSACEWFQKRATHALIHFTFRPSTPNNRVGRIMETIFLACSERPLPIISSLGVLPINVVRLPNQDMEKFIKVIPTVPKNVLKECDTFFKKAKEQKMIGEITLDDILHTELQNRTFTETEMTSLMKWWIEYNAKNHVKDTNRSTFLEYAILTWEGNASSLAKFNYFLNPKLIPPTNDFPADMLPYNVSKSFNKSELEKHFGNYKELSILAWVNFILNTPKLQQLESDAAFAQKFLSILGRSLASLSPPDQNTLRTLLCQKKVIPTKHGMRIPDEAYFSSVTLFPDLPTVEFQNPPEKLLTLLGVRKHVELQLIFDRLVSQGNWDHTQLVKYLASISNNLKTIEKKRLEITAIWPREQEQDNGKAGENGSMEPRIKRYLASELYAPLPELRDFQLPFIEWKGKWRNNSSEAKFLIDLGLRTYPPLDDILSLAAPPTKIELRRKALHYFMEKFKAHYATAYNSHSITIPFLPCTDSSIYSTPSDCFVNPACTIMGFNALHQDLSFRAAELGIDQHPPKQKLIERLRGKLPRNEDEARKVFEYLATQRGIFSHADCEMLGNVKFVPIRDKENKIVYTNPNSCFFKSQDESYKDFFSYIDFGDKANAFLRTCGVKSAPSPTELAWLLVRSSTEFWTKMGDDVEKYTGVLRSIAAHVDLISREPELFAEMSRSPILLGIRVQSSNRGTDDTIMDEDGSVDEVNHYALATAKNIFLNDDPNIWRAFSVLTCPVDELLENFYEKLGSSWLKRSVQTSYIPKGEAKTTLISARLEALIKERAALFFHERHRSEMRHDASWIQQNIHVKQVQEIQTRYLLKLTNQTKTELTTACFLTRGSAYILYIAGQELDYLDIAYSLSTIIYKKPRWNDTLLLSSVLTTPLQSLKRKGYPVERIMRAKREKRENIVVDKPQTSTLSSPAQSQHANTDYVNRLQEIFPDADPTHLSTLVSAETDNHVERVINKLLESGYPKQISAADKPKSRNGWFDKARDFFSDNIQNQDVGSSKGKKPVAVTSEDTDKLKAALHSAVTACRPNSGIAINNQATVNQVVESASHYCDVVPGHSLNFVGPINGMEVYASKDIVQAEVIGNPRIKHLVKFIGLLKELCDVFKLQTNAVHVFYDPVGESIAFNRDRALFFNLHFYEGLHSSDGEKWSSDSMIYWFFSFCHELAHNFVKVHNSEHEYFLSSFARNYTSALLKKLQQHKLI